MDLPQDRARTLCEDHLRKQTGHKNEQSRDHQNLQPGTKALSVEPTHIRSATNVLLIRCSLLHSQAITVAAAIDKTELMSQ